MRFIFILTEPPTRLEIQYAAESRPISDQQIQSNVKQDSDSIQNDITFMGPYIEGQNVSIVCTAFGGKNDKKSFCLRESSLSMTLKLLSKTQSQAIIETVERSEWYPAEREWVVEVILNHEGYCQSRGRKGKEICNAVGGFLLSPSFPCLSCSSSRILCYFFSSSHFSCIAHFFLWWTCLAFLEWKGWKK